LQLAVVRMCNALHDLLALALRTAQLRAQSRLAAGRLLERPHLRRCRIAPAALFHSLQLGLRHRPRL